MQVRLREGARTALDWMQRGADASLRQPLKAEPFEDLVVSSLVAKHWLMSYGLPKVRCSLLSGQPPIASICCQLTSRCGRLSLKAFDF